MTSLLRRGVGLGLIRWVTKRQLQLTSCAKSIEVKMPALSPTMTSGTIVKWLKQEGEEVVTGDVLCEIQTDKAVVALEFDEEGVVAKHLLPENASDIDVGTPIALIAETDEDWKDVAAKAPVGVSAGELTGAAATGEPVKPGVADDVHHDIMHLPMMAGPAVRLLLLLYGIKPTDVTATGRGGALLKHDVVQHIAKHSLQPKKQAAALPPAPAKPALAAPKPDAVKPSQTAGVAAPKPAAVPAPPPDRAGTYTDIPLSQARIEAGRQAAASKFASPQAHTSINIAVDEVLKLCSHFEGSDIKASLSDVAIKACAVAMQLVPGVNVHLVGNSAAGDEAIRYYASSQLSYIVKDPSDEVLKFASLGNVDVTGASGIHSALKAILSNDDAAPIPSVPATLSINDLSSSCIKEATSITDGSHTAILSIGASYDAITGSGDDINPSSNMTMTLSYDNRIIEEDTAARFLNTVRQLLEEPNLLIAGQVLPTNESLIEAIDTF